MECQICGREEGRVREWFAVGPYPLLVGEYNLDPYGTTFYAHDNCALALEAKAFDAWEEMLREYDIRVL